MKAPPTRDADGLRLVDRAEQKARRSCVLRLQSAPRACAARSWLMPDKQRATVILRMHHDLPHQQIADVLGNSGGLGEGEPGFTALRNPRRIPRGECVTSHLSPAEGIGALDGRTVSLIARRISTVVSAVPRRRRLALNRDGARPRTR